MFSDAEETSGTGTDTRSSWFPMRCRFGASPLGHHKIFNTRRAANNICHDSSVCVCMFVTSVCAYLRVGGEQFGVCIIDFDVCVEREWVFCIVGDDFFFGVVVGDDVVSIIDETVRVMQNKQTCRHDKMRHFLREEACFKRNHFVSTGNHFLESAAPDSYNKSSESHSGNETAVMSITSKHQIKSALWTVLVDMNAPRLRVTHC